VCQYTFPFLDRISAGGTIPVVGISQNGAEATEAFRAEYGLHFTLLLDPADDGYRISNAFRITHVPSVFLVEPDRQISHAFSGFSRSDLQAVGRRAGVEVFRQGEETPEFKPG
jgi:peroxiredoxin